MSSAGQFQNSDFSRKLAQFLDYLNDAKCNGKPDNIIKSIEKISNAALESGLPGIYELCITIISSLSIHADFTDSIKSDLSQIFDLVLQHSSQPESQIIMNDITGKINTSFLSGNISEDELLILRSTLELDSGQNHENANTELGIYKDDKMESDDVQKEDISGTTDDLEYNRPIKINDNIPYDLKELLHIMQSELIPIDKQILKSVHNLASGIPLENINDELTDCISSLDLYCEAVKSLDYEGLSAVIQHINNNIKLPENTDDLTGYINSLHELPPLLEKVFLYLEDPSNSGTIEQLIHDLKKSQWFHALSDKDIEKIGASLTINVHQDNSNDVSDQKIIVTEDDVSLSVPDDIDPELLDALLHELPDQIENLLSCIQKFNKDGSLEDIQTAKRIAHTLKGAGNTVGIRGIATITHKMEDILLALYKNNVLPKGNVLEILMRAGDCLAAMGDYLLDIGDAPPDAIEISQQLIDFSLQIEKHGIVENDHTVSNPDTKLASSPPPLTANDTREEPEKSIKVPMIFMDRLLKLVGESITSNKQILSNLHETIDLVKSNKNFYSELRYFGDKIEEIITTKDVYSSYSDNNKVNEYDDLEMDRFSDLHVYINQLIEKTVDAEESFQYFLDNLISLDEKLVELGRINSEIKGNVESSRLIPVSNYSSRLQRIVRQAAKLGGKNVSLQLSGLDTQIDSNILNNLIDSLIHLLRNAVDHGIENKEVRLACGKKPEGNIELHFSADDDEIRISCEDDGRGLARDSIRRKAIELGLLKEDENISDQDINKFIFHPDFSTKSETTELSGRGIGLDAVQSFIGALSGSITLTSIPDKGTRFEITLPSNQMIINAVLVGIGAEIVSLSSRGIDQIFYHDQIQFPETTDDKNAHVLINGNKFQAITLESILQIDFERRSNSRKHPLIILFSKNRSEKIAVLVDRILGCENMVLKGMGAYVPRIPGIMGISVLGDGDITSVIDVVELLNHKPDNSLKKKRKLLSESKLPTALVVDDSISVRRSLSEFMENIGYKVRTAHDGIEAFEIARACKPDIILTDMEMPRMNGIELTSYLKSSTDMSDIPVIMVTSRSAERHREEAMKVGIDAYLTKPYAEEELLEAIKHLHQSRE